MEDQREASGISRRDFLRAASGSAFALAAGGALAGCADNGSIPIQTHDQHGMYVSTYLNNTVERYNPTTGGREATISTGIKPNLNPPGAGSVGLAIAPDGQLWVANRFQDNVEKYDLISGNKLATISNVHAPYTIAVGTDGNLYVPSTGSNYGPPFGHDTVEKFDAVKGTTKGTFLQIDRPLGVVWGPDNNLYVSTGQGQAALDTLSAASDPMADSVTCFNGSNGGAIKQVVRGDRVPFDMVFTPGGTLLVSEFLDNRIQEYDPATGTVVRTFANISHPVGMTYGPDGDLYVGSNSTQLAAIGNSGTVVRLDGKTGALKQNFISGLPFAMFIVFV